MGFTARQWAGAFLGAVIAVVYIWALLVFAIGAWG
jgi:hypothetical protein